MKTIPWSVGCLAVAVLLLPARAEATAGFAETSKHTQGGHTICPCDHHPHSAILDRQQNVIVDDLGSWDVHQRGGVTFISGDAGGDYFLLDESSGVVTRFRSRKALRDAIKAQGLQRADTPHSMSEMMGATMLVMFAGLFALVVIVSYLMNAVRRKIASRA